MRPNTLYASVKYGEPNHSVFAADAPLIRRSSPFFRYPRNVARFLFWLITGIVILMMSTAGSQAWSIALTAILSAVYVAYAVLAGYLVGYVTHGVDNFILRSLVFVVLAAMTVRFGYCTIMGGVTGIVLEFAIPTPVPFHLVLSLIAYGVVIDVLVNFKRDISKPPSALRLLLGTVVASLAMSSTALAVFTLVGFFPIEVLPFIWGLEITIDVTLGIIGGVIGAVLVRRITHLK